MTGSHDMTDEPRDDQSDTEADIRRAGNLLRSAMPPASFAEGFADRTMARLAATRIATSPAVLRVAAMQRSFRLLAAAAAVAIIALGVHNTLIVREADATFVEAAIGLQPVSAESVFSSSEILQ
jgi:hypothetical protein